LSLNVLSLNVLSLNVLSLNVLSLNVLSLNVLSLNVLSLNVLSLNVLSIFLFTSYSPFEIFNPEKFTTLGPLITFPLIFTHKNRITVVMVAKAGWFVCPMVGLRWFLVLGTNQ
jgi:hypothetical protein